MGHRDLLKGWRRGAAVTALTVIILGAGLCYFDQDEGGMDDHAILQDLCFLALMVSSPVILLLVGLLHTLARDPRVPVFAAVPLPVPKPPPRRAAVTLFLSV